ncbi:sensor histidine kinase [Jiella avicenniae]|uniref:C4-dicarboxylate transport sensor protein DctB n=1 Tax=Jiella avicenniae TaxID=2907202 RepID=A0A9X1T6H4_9HYPH|nr:ATP-binding protein [Jiella avicenniae]MCE7029904.1 ATP-binding protein [Jiella avicenniae]
MASRRGIRERFRRVRLGAALVVTGLSLAAIWLVAGIQADAARIAVGREAAETLAVQRETLTGVLDKYRLLPPLLSRQHDVAALFRQEPDTGERMRARAKAREVASLSGAKDVAFLYPDGEVLASAHGFFLDRSPDREALIEAVRQGRLGRAAIAIDSDERAYAFASGVRDDLRLTGIVVVYVGFDEIEATWSLSTNPIFVTDPAGTIFLTNQPQWRLRPLHEIADDGLPERRFKVGAMAVPYLDLVRDLPLLDWRLHVLADARPVMEAQLTGGLMAALAALLAAALVALVVWRRERAVLGRRAERVAALRLERLVRDRTRALNATNRSLSSEIAERRQAEERLRKAQADLVQAAKLAALGQMSAALSHEFNQPLAAIATYAENAGEFLARGRDDLAGDNLKRIGQMVERMAELSRTLLSFARKPGTSTMPVPLAAVLDEAMILVGPRARKEGVALVVDERLRAIDVVGGRTRLSQIFVNLANNAIDALAGRPGAEIRVELEGAGDVVVVLVSDNGPGIPAEIGGTVFEPFFTTKEVGSGIGIGLSIAYSIARDFGGSIALRDGPQGGCVFAVSLRAAAAGRQAAE